MIEREDRAVIADGLAIAAGPLLAFMRLDVALKRIGAHPINRVCNDFLMRTRDVSELLERARRQANSPGHTPRV